MTADEARETIRRLALESVRDAGMLAKLGALERSLALYVERFPGQEVALVMAESFTLCVSPDSVLL